MRTSVFAPTRRLIGAAFLTDFAVGVAGLGVTELAMLRGASPFVLGIIGTIGSTAYTLGCLFTGRLSDKYGRRRSVLVSAVITASAWLVVSNATSPWQILCLVPLQGLGLSLFWPPLQAWLAELTEGGRRELNRNLGLFNILWCAGLLLGPVVCGYVWDWGQYWPFGIGIGTMALVLFIALRTPTAAQAQTANGNGDEPSETPHADAGVFLRLSWVGNFTSWFASRSIGALFPKLGHDLGFSTSLVGWLLASVYFGQLALFWLGRRSERWMYRRWPLFVAQGIAFGGMILAYLVATQELAWVSPALFLVAFSAVGLCGGVTYIGSLFYSLHGRTDDKGGKTGLHEAVLGSGGLLGPILGGYVASLAGLRTLFLMVAAAYVLATLAQVGIWRTASYPPVPPPSEGGG